MGDETKISNLKADERIVFFTTDGWLSEDRKTWNIPVHAWVHEYERASIRRAAIATALRARYGLKATSQTRDNFDHRARLLVADNERGKRIVIELAGERVLLPATGSNGHTTGMFRLDASVVSRAAQDDRLRYTAILTKGDARRFSGSVHLVPPDGLSVISDFDDTVKITHATNRSAMLDKTLYQDYTAVIGMSDLYASWVARGATIHFVSSSPWHLYEPFEEFLTRNGFPRRTMSLKYFRFKDSTLINLVRKGTETKPTQIYPILESFPHRNFVLVGDSGQEDPEVYAQTFKKYTNQITHVYIRNVTGASRDDDRFREVFDGIAPAKWTLFDDPEELDLPQ